MKAVIQNIPKIKDVSINGIARCHIEYPAHLIVVISLRPDSVKNVINSENKTKDGDTEFMKSGVFKKAINIEAPKDTDLSDRSSILSMKLTKNIIAKNARNILRKFIKKDLHK